MLLSRLDVSGFVCLAGIGRPHNSDTVLLTHPAQIRHGFHDHDSRAVLFHVWMNVVRLTGRLATDLKSRDGVVRQPVSVSMNSNVDLKVLLSFEITTFIPGSNTIVNQALTYGVQPVLPNAVYEAESFAANLCVDVYLSSRIFCLCYMQYLLSSIHKMAVCLLSLCRCVP